MSESELQAENEKLRAEVEAFRQRELAELRSQLAAAWKAADDYRAQALQNAGAVRQVNAMAEETISRLKAQLEVREHQKLAAVRNRPRADIGRN